MIVTHTGVSTHTGGATHTRVSTHTGVATHMGVATHTRVTTLPLVATLVAVSIVVGLGCSDPDRVILESFAQSGSEGESAAKQAQFRRGRALAGECWTCHDLAGSVKKVGPSLLGLYGRRSGNTPDYSASPALIGASVVWGDRSLAAFLSNPAGFIPGNRMVSPGLRDASQLSDLLFYLRHVTRPGAREAPANESR